MKNVVITGANGFVGGALTRELLAHDYTIHAVDRPGCSNNLPEDKRVNFVPCDMAEIATLKEKLPDTSLDLFFHLAWAGSAGVDRADTSLQLQNVQWTVDALRTAKKLGCKRFLCAGSIVEHETLGAAYTQGSRPGMGYIYGGGKIAAHVFCMSVAVQLGIDLVWPAITNAYGPGEKSTRLVNATIRKCIRGVSPEFTSGTQNYDFVYIEDVARAFRLIGERGKPFHEYLIGSSHARPLRQFLLEMQASIAPELEFKFGEVPYTGINLPLSAFDCFQTEADTGFRSKVSFADGCRKTYDWWKEQDK